jgi:predicted ATPase/transcriptional regulator with XRE-family HTH domain
METTSPFGPWLKQRRQQLDLTQEAVAEATGCSLDTIRKIEAGRRRPSRQIAELLAEFLHVAPSDVPAFVLWARGMADSDPFSSFTTQRSPAASADARSSQPAPAFGDRRLPSSSLPLLPTQLIGRERELVSIKELLWRSTTRLLTLLGPPGIGKTSLGIALASALQADFKDGLLFVSLGPVSDPSLVAATLAEALGVRETDARSLLHSLQDALRDKQMFLILDNFEHVISAAPLIADLLAAAPQLKVIITSRSPLHLRGEKLVEVRPLDMPDPGHIPSSKELEQISSVALFVERVRDVKSDFALTPENAPVVAAICSRLDGLPLAIELAAARTRLLSLHALLSRLDRQLTVLAGGPRDAPVHHKALRDALESSYRLLEGGEQRLFRRLGIFPGPFTLEAAEGVAGATLDQMEAILDQSLLRSQMSVDGQPITDNSSQAHLLTTDNWYVMLMPVREFALEQLDAAGERHDIALRHARYFLDMALAMESEYRGPSQKLWLDRIEGAYNDIRAALDWTLKNEQVEITLRLGEVMRHFWLNRGHRQEGLAWLEQALAKGDGAPADARAAGLLALGTLSYRHGEHDTAERYFSSAVVLSREAGERLLVTHSLLGLGQTLTDLGKYERAIQAFEETISISEELDDKVNLAKALGGLGRIMSRQGDFAQAIAWQEKALAIRRQLGIPIDIAQNLQNLGSQALKQGDYRRAIVYAEESVAIDSETGNMDNLTYALGLAGKAALGLGDFERAATNFGRCLSVFTELGSITMVAFVFEEIARVDIRLGQPAKAARLFGVAEALRESVGAAVDLPDRAERDATIASLRQALSEHQFNAAWLVGRAMPLEEAISYTKASGEVRER